MSARNQQPKLAVLNESPTRYDWAYIRHTALEHKGKLVKAHIIAIFATLMLSATRLAEKSKCGRS